MNAIIPANAVRTALEAAVPDLALMLPADIPAERFKAVVITAVQTNPQLRECDRDSLWNACRKAANDGLLPDGREGAIVPRFDRKKGGMVAHWMPMVHGIIAKAKRKGGVKSLVANVVYEGEAFDVILGDEEKLVHRRDITKVRKGKEIAVYAIARLEDGTPEREIMTWQQVMDVKEAANADKGPWQSWPDEMARKTVIRRLSKRLPSLDDELRRVIERVDENYDFGRKPVDDGAVFEGTAEEVEPALDEAPPPEPDPLPLLGADGKLHGAPNLGTWERWLNAALSRLDSRERVAGYRASMGPHLGSIAGLSEQHASAVRAAEERIEARLRQLGEAEAPAGEAE